jgi:transcriptional regulator with XRE-family HTH domain
MKKIIDIRKKLGISQEELANWLQVSRSTINNYEQGTHSLATNALIALAEIEIAYHQSSQKTSFNLQDRTTHAAKANTQSLCNDLLKQEAYCRRLAATLEKKLSKMKAVYAGMCVGMHLYETRAALLARAGTNNAELKWLEILQEKQHRKMIGFGKEAQFVLQHRIDCLLREANDHARAYDMLNR